MTNEEAIKYLSNNDNFTYDGIPKNLIEYNDAIDLAIDAIEKQIPKKPFEEHQCPRCKEILHGYLQLYCGDCGQAIDWGE